MQTEKKKSSTPAKLPATLKFDDALAELEAITRKLESEALPFEEMTALFEKANLLTRFCREKLNGFKKRGGFLLAESAGEGNGEWEEFDEERKLRK